MTDDQRPMGLHRSGGKYQTSGKRDSILETLADLERRVKTLETAPRAPLTSVDSGAFIVKGGIFEVWRSVSGDDKVFQIGKDLGAPGSGPGFRFIWASNGTASISQEYAFAGDPETEGLSLWDRDSGLPVFSTDGTGKGLFTPYLALPFRSTSNINVPVDTTTSASFISLYGIYFLRQHPGVFCMFTANCTSSSTGEARLLDIDRGVEVAAPIPLAAGSFFYALQTSTPLLGNNLDSYAIELQARRTSGAGTVGITLIQAYGIGD